MTDSRRLSSDTPDADAHQADEAGEAAARRRMVETQIERRGVRDPRVLEAMRRVPRHAFVPPHLRNAAYDDRPLPIGSGQTISQPYMVAAMTAALAPTPDDRVLEVGTGSGYQAAILGCLVRQVVSVERVPALAERAAARIASLGIANVEVVVGDGSLGWPAAAPYDRILVTAGAPEVPSALVDQLGAGGTLVVPVGSRAMQRLCIVRRSADGGRVDTETLEACVFVPLVGALGWGGEDLE